MRRIRHTWAQGPVVALAGYVAAVSCWALLRRQSILAELSGHVPGFVILAVAAAAWTLYGSRVRGRANLFLPAASRLFDEAREAAYNEDLYGGVAYQVSGEACGLYDGRTTSIAFAEYQGSGEGERRKRLFHIRMSCDAPLKFDVKAWGVLIGPPLLKQNVPAELSGGEPVDFTTRDMEAFTFWRGRRDCRDAAEQLIVRRNVSAVRVGEGWLEAWWDLAAFAAWKRALVPLPGALDGMARLARILDPKQPEDRRRKRACNCCGGALGPADAFCTVCGRGWWETAARA